jgi:hypothetical protein
MSIVKWISDHVTNFVIRGISFTSRKRGWAFDNVKNFEVSLKFHPVYSFRFTNFGACIFQLPGKAKPKSL